MRKLDLTESWAPRSCTLPTVEQPLRVAEFDQLFARAVRGVDRPEPGRVWLELEPTAEVAARTAELVVRETGCCSFFTFTLTAFQVQAVFRLAAQHKEIIRLRAAQTSGGVFGSLPTGRGSL